MTPELVAAWLRETGWRPHRLAKDLRSNLYEFISYPFTEGKAVMVMVRVPGDPTTLRKAPALNLSPEGRDCYCAAGGEFYCDPAKAWRYGEPVGEAVAR